MGNSWKDLFFWGVSLKSNKRCLFDWHIQDLCDARIAIGFGKVDYFGKTLAESDGEVFRNSGRELDKLGKRNRISIKTNEKEINEELEVELSMLDSIIQNWSFLQSRAVYEKILEPKQSIVAKKLGVTEGGLSLRLSAASWNSIEKLLNRYNECNINLLYIRKSNSNTKSYIE